MTDAYKKTGDNSWIVTVQQDGKTKELYLEFPQDALDQVGWDEGDTLLWEELPNGNWTLTKKEDDPFKDLNDAVERIKAKQASNKVIKEAQKRGDSSAVSSAIKEAKRVEDIIEARQKGASIGFKQGGLASRKKKK